MDRLKDLGYHHSTLAGLTVGIADIPVVEDKAEIIEESHKRVEQITKQFRRGLITDDERYNAVTAEWRAAREKLENAWWITKIRRTNRYDDGLWSSW